MAGVEMPEEALPDRVRWSKEAKSEHSLKESEQCYCWCDVTALRIWIMITTRRVKQTRNKVQAGSDAVIFARCEVQ